MCGFSICFLKSRLYPDSKHEGLNILITASACFHAPRTRTRAHTHTHTHTQRSICTTPMVCTISLNVGGGHRAPRGFQLTLLLTMPTQIMLSNTLQALGIGQLHEESKAQHGVASQKNVHVTSPPSLILCLMPGDTSQARDLTTLP